MLDFRQPQRGIAMIRVLAVAIVAGVCVHSASAQTLLYSNDFETAVRGPEWSSNTIFTHHENFSWFVGRYTEDQGVTLTLAAPPKPTCGGTTGGGSTGSGGTTGSGGGTGTGSTGGSTGGTSGGESSECCNLFTLMFDLYIIDSWDGYLTPHGPDHFQVLVNDVMIFDETFANQHHYQSFRAPDVGPMHMGFNSLYKDSIYRDISIPFTIGDAETISIRFRSQGLHSMADESWGLDNVRVSYVPIPSPGAMGLLCAGLLVMAPRRRR
jgi:hypothetical protein